MRARDELEVIRRLIHRETKYLRTYLGKVISTEDSLQRGRVQCEIPGLEWLGEGRAIWCWPRQIAGVVPPMEGQFVEVSFRGGRLDQAVYQGVAHEIAGNKPPEYERPGKPVLFQDPETEDYVTYDRDEQTMEVFVKELMRLLSDRIDIGEGTEPVALADALVSYLDDLKSWADGHTHGPGTYATSQGPVTGASGSPASGSPTVPGDDIKSGVLHSE